MQRSRNVVLRVQHPRESVFKIIFHSVVRHYLVEVVAIREGRELGGLQEGAGERLISFITTWPKVKLKLAPWGHRHSLPDLFVSEIQYLLV